MEGFFYNDIFASKGIEYIAIIAFLILLIPFSIVLNKQKKIRQHIQKGIRFLSASILNIPQGIYYCRNHTWAYLEKSGSARVGLDDLLLHIVGDVKVKSLRNPGDSISKGELLAELDQQGKILSIFAPVSGTVLDRNEMLQEDNSVLNEDPYGKGWIYKIKPSRWIAETSSYYLAEDAKVWSQRELNRFKDFVAQSLKNYSSEPATLILQDGGEVSDNALAEMPEQAWNDFQKEFLAV